VKEEGALLAHLQLSDLNKLATAKLLMPSEPAEEEE